MNQDLIKEVALEGAEKFGVVADDSEIVDLVTWCVAELSKRAEAVAWYDGNKFYANEKSAICGCADMGKLVKVFTFPPIHDIEAIENRVAEACAKVYLETYDLTDIADDVRSGEWRKYK